MSVRDPGLRRKPGRRRVRPAEPPGSGTEPGDGATDERRARRPHLAIPLRLHLGLHTLAFVLGLSAVFVALGYSAGWVSDALFDYGRALRIGAGLLLIAMGAVMLRAVPLPWLARDLRVHLQTKPSGYAGSGLVGVAFAAGWTPCIGPILAGILAIAAAGADPLGGARLLGVYALGFAIPFLVLAQLLPAWNALRRHTRTIERIGAVALLVVGALLLTGSVETILRWLGPLAAFSAETALLDATSRPTLGLAFGAGALSFLSPCVLPILPSFLAYLTGMNVDALARTGGRD